MNITPRRLHTGVALHLTGSGIGTIAVIFGFSRFGSPYSPGIPLLNMLIISGLIGFYAPRHHPFEGFGSANTVTLVRATLTNGLAGFLVSNPTPTVLGFISAITLICLMLDGIDGALARHTGMSSNFGARFDMEVDAFLILILSVLLMQFYALGTWVLSLGLMRYGFIAGGYIWHGLRQPLPESFRRKFICVIQIISLTLALNPLLPPPTRTCLLFAALLLLSYSFGVDIWWLFWHQTKKKP